MFQIPTIGYKSEGPDQWKKIDDEILPSLHKAAHEGYAHASGKWLLVRMEYFDWEKRTTTESEMTMWNLYPRFADGIHSDKVFVHAVQGQILPPLQWAAQQMAIFAKNASQQ